MKTPNNMSESETLEIIMRVIKRISKKYTFYGYTEEDIQQEAFIICVEALERYDEKRPLENFLSVNLSNRLKNFIRDNHFVIGDDPVSEAKMRVLQPAQLDYESALVDEEGKFSINDDEYDNESLSELVNELLPASMRMDYLKIINDVYVSKARRDEILERVQIILEDNGYGDR